MATAYVISLPMLEKMATGAGFALDMAQVGDSNTATVKGDAPAVLSPVADYGAFAIAKEDTVTYDGSGDPVVTWIGINETVTPAFNRAETSFYSSVDATVGVRAWETPAIPISSGATMAVRLRFTQRQAA